MTISILTKKNTIIIFIIVLVVLGIYLFSKKKAPIESCSGIADLQQKILCWKKIIDQDLLQGDLNQTMELVSKKYSEDTDFAKNCHDFMHSVGKTAYGLFSGGRDFKVGDKSSYCAYGFYHGFMENLVSQSGDISLARSFCKKVDDELSASAPGAKLACYHGIGHGWTNLHDPKVYGNERAMVDPAIALCEKVTQDPEELKICATGVFDSISIGYYSETDGLKVNKQDPYWLCEEQKDKYKTPCYMDLTPTVIWLGEFKLDKSLYYLRYVDVKYKDLVTETIAEDAVRFILRDSRDVGDQVRICRSLGSHLNLVCLGGLAKGYLQFGAPGQEEASGVSFCENNALTADEKKFCFSKILQTIKAGFSKQRSEIVCGQVPEEFKKYCD